MTMERRALGHFIAESPTHLVGYASVFNRLSEDLGGFREQISPSAFRRTVEDSEADVRALVNHDSTMVLGRRISGTLELSTDEHGLKIKILMPQTTYARDLTELVRRGDVSQMSFGIIVQPGGDNWGIRDGQRVRTVTDVQLLEVSVVSVPAYPDTTVALRSRDSWDGRRARQSRERVIRLLNISRSFQ